MTVICVQPLPCLRNPNSSERPRPALNKVGQRQGCSSKALFVNASASEQKRGVDNAKSYFAHSPENICRSSSEFAWEFCIEKWQGFLVKFFLVSVSHETKHENSSKNWKKIRGKFGKKFRKIRETFVLQLF